MEMELIGRRNYLVAFLVSGFFILSIKCSDDENVVIDNNHKQLEDENMAIIDAVNSLFSLRSRDKKNIFFQQRQSWLYSPNPTLESEDGGGATEKVKDAVVKSLDKSRTTVEDSAKLAAQFADQAVDKTVKKLKKTLSATDHQHEL